MVNIDFGQIFDTGLNSPIPEKVNFRFTQNILGALSPLGIQGIFKAVSINALIILIKYKEKYLAMSNDFINDQINKNKVNIKR